MDGYAQVLSRKYQLLWSHKVKAMIAAAAAAALDKLLHRVLLPPFGEKYRTMKRDFFRFELRKYKRLRKFFRKVHSNRKVSSALLNEY